MLVLDFWILIIGVVYIIFCSCRDKIEKNEEKRYNKIVEEKHELFRKKYLESGVCVDGKYKDGPKENELRTIIPRVICDYDSVRRIYCFYNITDDRIFKYMKIAYSICGINEGDYYPYDLYEDLIDIAMIVEYNKLSRKAISIMGNGYKKPHIVQWIFDNLKENPIEDGVYWFYDNCTGNTTFQWENSDGCTKEEIEKYGKNNDERYIIGYISNEQLKDGYLNKDWHPKIPV